MNSPEIPEIPGSPGGDGLNAQQIDHPSPLNLSGALEAAVHGEAEKSRQQRVIPGGSRKSRRKSRKRKSSKRKSSKRKSRKRKSSKRKSSKARKKRKGRKGGGKSRRKSRK